MGPLRSRSCPLRTAVFALVCAALCAPARLAYAQAAFETTPCFSPSDAQGRGQFPPNCDHGFSSHESAILIEAGLPAGVALGGRLRLSKMNVTSALDGGALGGKTVNFTATLRLEMRGYGGLSRVNRRVLLPLTGTFITAPQFAADSVQSFDFELTSATATLSGGDKDFATLQFLSGAAHALPSLGHAVYTRQPDGEWASDAWLDLHYSLAFTGAAAGDLAGLAGTTVSSLHTLAGRVSNPSTLLPDDGSGSIVWPPVAPEGGPSVTEGMFSLQRLNPARAMLVRMNLRTAPGAALYPGSPLGGGLSVGADQLELELFGEGAWSGFHRTLTVPVQTFVHWGPEPDHQALQGRAADVYLMFGELAGDPDFSLLRISGGTGFGLPSLGHTTLERQASDGFKLDSGYDLGYRVEWTGAQGGPLAGESSLMQNVLTLQSGREREGDCEAPDDGSGSAAFPPPCSSGFTGEPAALALLNGLPAGSPLLARVQLSNVAVSSRSSGGPLDGETQNLTANLVLTLEGTGEFAGYARTLTLPATIQTATAPYVKAPGPQHFQVLLNSISASLPLSDPDFESLDVIGGQGFGFGSPGATTFTPASGGHWNVESALDMGYRLAFVGKVGSAFAGYAGSTDTRAHLVAGSQPVVLAAPPRPAANMLRVSPAMPNPTRGPLLITLDLPRRSRVQAAVHDVLGRQVRVIAEGWRDGGVQGIAWDGRDGAGRGVPPGLYMIRVNINGERFSRRVVLSH